MLDNAAFLFKSKLRKANKSGIVLDIDETLSWTIGHWVGEMQLLFGNPEGLTVKELIKKYRYTQHVPYWQTKEAVNWMVDAIYSNELQERLPLIEDANLFVQRINKIVPVVGYVTVRPVDVIPGTKRWLKKHKFPDVEVIAKPKNIKRLDGNKWKAGVINDLYPEVVGIIDDNPSLVQCLPEGYKGTVYLYDYDNKESLREDIKVYTCKTWKDVHTKVKLLNKV